MQRLILLSSFLLFAGIALAQSSISLLPTDMQKYLGKVTREQFEEIVGEPVGTEDEFVVYEVMNTYGEILTEIRCYFREKDNKLISVRFGTPHYLGYWINSTDVFKKSEEKITKQRGEVIKVEAYSVSKKFGMQILDIVEYPHGGSTATINYHIK